MTTEATKETKTPIQLVEGQEIVVTDDSISIDGNVLPIGVTNVIGVSPDGEVVQAMLVAIPFDPQEKTTKNGKTLVSFFKQIFRCLWKGSDGKWVDSSIPWTMADGSRPNINLVIKAEMYPDTGNQGGA